MHGLVDEPVLIDGFFVLCHADPFAVVIKQNVDVVEEEDVYLPLIAIGLLEDGVAYLAVLYKVGSLRDLYCEIGREGKGEFWEGG